MCIRDSFKSEETREIEYVLIEDKPSAKDEEEMKAKINGLLTGSVVYNKETGKNDTLPSFRNATNVADFVGANSDKPYDSTYVTKQNLPAEHADKLFALPAGEISVSYTHLDVYKRQGNNIAIVVYGFFMGDLLMNWINSFGFQSVSYTHLDVYKRQGLVREHYMNFSVGLSLNDRWFQKRKYD